MIPIVQVSVRNNDVEQALRALKRKSAREGVQREVKARRFHEKPSAKRVRVENESKRRVRKLERKRRQRDGL